MVIGSRNTTFTSTATHLKEDYRYMYAETDFLRDQYSRFVLSNANQDRTLLKSNVSNTKPALQSGLLSRKNLPADD